MVLAAEHLCCGQQAETTDIQKGPGIFSFTPKQCKSQAWLTVKSD